MEKTDMHLDGDTLCDFAEGSLDASARTAAEAHLQACAVCRRELQVVRAYFQEMSGLEPVRAPADFLANVRARLPRPSPWKSAWSVFMRPWRVVPLQIALATILGITAITAYLHQRGGLSESPLMLPAAPSALPAAPAIPAPAAEPRAKAEKAKAGEEAVKAAEVDKADKAGEEKESLRKNEIGEGRAALQKKSVSSGILNDAMAARDDKSAKPKAEPRPSPAPSAPSGAASLSERENAAVNQPKDRVGSSSRDEMAQAASGSLAKAPSRPAPPAAPAVPEAEALPLSSSMSSPGEDAEATGMPAAKAAVPKREIREPEGYGGGAQALGSAAKQQRTDAEEDLPGFTVRLRNAKDTTALLAGLRAMGAETGPRQAGDGVRYVLRIPRSMIPEMRSYLERYGKTGRQGDVSAAPGPKVRIFLRAILP